MGNSSGLSEMRASIRNGKLVTARTLAVEDVSTVLDDRDVGDFEREWMRVYGEIGEGPLGDEAQDAVKALAEEAFKKCYEFENGDQLAPYISDDFDLFGRALLLDFDDEWLRKLWTSYVQERFPHGLLSGKCARPIGEF